MTTRCSCRPSTWRSWLSNGRQLAASPCAGRSWEHDGCRLFINRFAQRRSKKGKKRKPKTSRQTEKPPGDTPPLEVPPLVFSQYGCIEVGQPCRGDSTNCCSGICEGAAPTAEQPDQSRCIAHDTGTCKQAAEGLCTAPDIGLATCNNRSDSGCFRTTAGSNYCGELFGGPGISQCVSCQRDAVCLAAGLPPASACAPVSEGSCAGICSTGMACLVPCGAVQPGQ
jgi:hypothetical protein